MFWKNIKKLTTAILGKLSEQGKDSNIILTSKRQAENIASSRKSSMLMNMYMKIKSHISIESE